MSETAQEVELALDHRCRLAVVHGIILLLLIGIVSPSHSKAADLAYLQQTNRAPLKGMERSLTGHDTIDWSYLYLRHVMTGTNEFNWNHLETMLTRSSVNGKHLIIRPVMDAWSTQAALPLYLTNVPGAVYKVENSHAVGLYPKGGMIPVYTNAETRAAMTNFIRAFAEKYDGDPRLGFIEAGLLGPHGEWYNINIRSWAASHVPLEIKREVLQAYQTHFKKTKVLVRWPDQDLPESSFGYHDDWFAFWKIRDSLYKKQTNAGPETLLRWRTSPIGARLHPEFDTLERLRELPPQLVTQDYLLRLIQRDHISWIRTRDDRRHIPMNLLWGLEDMAPKMGYEFHVSHAAWKHESRPQSLLHLSVTITNTAVAPFYYSWPMEIGLWHDKKLQQTWPVDWDIRRILPGETSITYTATLNEFPRRLKNARLLLHVVNPMKSGFPLRFANQTQDADLDGWLTLGGIENK
jgi:hypothetical protein